MLNYMKIMKTCVTALSMMLALSASTPLEAQSHRHHQQPVAASAVAAPDSAQQDELEAFSDTTSSADPSTQHTVVIDDEDMDQLRQVAKAFEDLDTTGIAGMLWILLLVFLLFVLSPVLILGLILYFIYKNRKERLRLAEMAMQTGQPIPDGVMNQAPPVATDDDMRAKGIRQLALGVGLMIFLGYTAGEVGFGLGALVACIGLGKLVISWNSNKNNYQNTTNDYEQL